MLQPGDALDRYIVEHYLGTLALGDVYRVRDAASGRSARALVLATGPDDSPELADDLDDLIAHNLRVEHPHVVPIRERMVWDGRDVLLCADGPGGTMQDRVDSPAAEPFDALVPVTEAIMSALVYLHAHKLVHGGLEPGAIAVAPSGAPLVLWTGVAPLLAPSTRARRAEGRAFIAPEVRDEVELHPTADLFSVGLLLLSLMSAELPFEPEDLDARDRFVVEVDRWLAPFSMDPIAKDALRAMLRPSPDGRPRVASVARFALVPRGALGRTKIASHDLHSGADDIMRAERNKRRRRASVEVPASRSASAGVRTPRGPVPPPGQAAAPSPERTAAAMPSDASTLPTYPPPASDAAPTHASAPASYAAPTHGSAAASYAAPIHDAVTPPVLAPQGTLDTPSTRPLAPVGADASLALSAPPSYAPVDLRPDVSLGLAAPSAPSGPPSSSAPSGDGIWSDLPDRRNAVWGSPSLSGEPTPSTPTAAPQKASAKEASAPELPRPLIPDLDIGDAAPPIASDPDPDALATEGLLILEAVPDSEPPELSAPPQAPATLLGLDFELATPGPPPSSPAPPLVGLDSPLVSAPAASPRPDPLATQVAPSSLQTVSAPPVRPPSPAAASERWEVTPGHDGTSRVGLTAEEYRYAPEEVRARAYVIAPQAAAASPEAVSPSQSVPPRRRRPWLIAVVIGITVVIGVALAIGDRGGDEDPDVKEEVETSSVLATAPPAQVPEAAPVQDPYAHIEPQLGQPQLGQPPAPQAPVPQPGQPQVAPQPSMPTAQVGPGLQPVAPGTPTPTQRAASGPLPSVVTGPGVPPPVTRLPGGPNGS